MSDWYNREYERYTGFHDDFDYNAERGNKIAQDLKKDVDTVGHMSHDKDITKNKGEKTDEEKTN
jgi:hypothetical protein